MRLLRIFLLSWAFLASSAWAADSLNTKDPSAMVQQLATQTLEKIKQQPELLDDTLELRNILYQDLLPHIHYRFAAFKVIGPAIKTTKKEQREAFAEAFKNYMLGTFTLLFKQFDPERHQIVFDAIRIPGQIPARFVAQGRPDISLIFYTRQNKKTQEWKVWDLAAEGISQVETKHKEFKPMIRQHGLDYVTAKLNEKVNNGLSSEELSGLPENEKAQ